LSAEPGHNGSIVSYYTPYKMSCLHATGTGSTLTCP